ncbi:MAG: lipid IV(A) 3-deoxy-D-manno-octulosonic acid transferase [Pseudomonadales bacterium]
MSRRLYSLLLYLSVPLILLRLLWRARKAPDYRRRIGERFGLGLTVLQAGGIWIHAVSVGETLAALPLIKKLQAEYPQRRIIVTTMTPTGSAQVRRSFGDSVTHVYAPYDLPFAVRRFLDAMRPEILLIIETELWPNILHCSAQRGTPILLMNARLSQNSAQGYARLGRLTRTMLRNLTFICAQNAADAKRFTNLGLASDRITVTGSIKFDVHFDQALRAQAEQVRAQWSAGEQRRIWIAASTHHGEDAIVVAAQQQLLLQFPDLLLVIVPRHPERFDAVYELCQASGIIVQRRSRVKDLDKETRILLADTMGELSLLFGACDIAFVGGSLVPTGGHNLIEPAAWGLPVICGPHLFNFTDVARALAEQGGLTIVQDERQLSMQLKLLLNDAEMHQQAGVSNRRVVEQNRGALQRQFETVQRYLS